MTSPTNANRRTPRRDRYRRSFFMLDNLPMPYYNILAYMERELITKNTYAARGDDTHDKKPTCENLIPFEKRKGETPMTKNVRVLSSEGIMIGVTYPKRALGLVKKGRARYLDGDESVIILASPPVDETSQEDEMKENFNFDEYIVKALAAAKTAGDAVIHVTEKVADKTEESLDHAIARMADAMREYLDKKEAEKDSEIEKAESIKGIDDELDDYIDELEDSYDELEDELDDLSDELEDLQDELDELEELEDDEDSDEELAESRREEIREKLEEIAERIKSKVNEYEIAIRNNETVKKCYAKVSAYAEDVAHKAKATYDEHMREFEARRAEKRSEAEAEAIAKAQEAQEKSHASDAPADDTDALIAKLIAELGRPGLSGAAQGAYRETLGKLMHDKEKKMQASLAEQQKKLADKQMLLGQAVKSIAETDDPDLIEFFAEKARKLVSDGALSADTEAEIMRLLAGETDPQKRNAYMDIIR